MINFEQYRSAQMEIAMLMTEREKKDLDKRGGLPKRKKPKIPWQKRKEHFLERTQDAFVLLRIALKTLVSALSIKTKYDYVDAFVAHRHDKARKALKAFFSAKISKEQIENATKIMIRHVGAEKKGTLDPSFSYLRSPQIPHVETDNPFISGESPKEQVKGLDEVKLEELDKQKE